MFFCIHISIQKDTAKNNKIIRILNVLFTHVSNVQSLLFIMIIYELLLLVNYIIKFWTFNCFMLFVYRYIWNTLLIYRYIKKDNLWWKEHQIEKIQLFMNGSPFHQLEYRNKSFYMIHIQTNSEICLNQTLNKPEFCIYRTLNNVKCRKSKLIYPV
jgi:hypothetical protein